MKFLTIFVMIGAALAAPSIKVRLDREPRCCGPDLCQPPRCMMVHPKFVLTSVAGEWYFKQISEKNVVLANPLARNSGKPGPRWVSGPEPDCLPQHEHDCHFIPYEDAKAIYEDAKAIYEEFKTLEPDAMYDLLRLDQIPIDYDSSSDNETNKRDEL